MRNGPEIRFLDQRLNKHVLIKLNWVPVLVTFVKLVRRITEHFSQYFAFAQVPQMS